jgi:hypothetical protein
METARRNWPPNRSGGPRRPRRCAQRSRQARFRHHGAGLFRSDEAGETWRKITNDPRVHVSQADLVQQLEAAKKVSGTLKSSYDAFHAAEALWAAAADRRKSLAALLKDNPQVKDASDALEDLDAQIEAIQSGTRTEPGFGSVNRDLAREMHMIETGDAAPSESAQARIADSCAALGKALADWRQLSSQALPPANALLDRYKFPPPPIAAAQ